MARRLTLFAVLLLLLVGFLWSRTRRAGSGSGEPLTQDASPAPGVVELLPARALPSEAAAADSTSAPTRQEAPPRSMPTLVGRVVPGPGVVLLPGETLEGHEVEWWPPTKLTPRFDAQGNALTPLETFGAAGGLRTLGPDGSFEFAPVPTGVELTLRLFGELGEGQLVCAPLAQGERRFVELELTRGSIELDEGAAPCRLVSGTVLDERGVTAEDVLVRLRSQELEDEFEVWTDEEGRFRFECVPAGTGIVWVEPEYSAEKRHCARGVACDFDASAADVRSLALAIERGATLAGTVEWSDGSPVDLFTGEFDGYEVEGEAGRFAIEHLPAEAGELWILAREEGRHGWFNGRATPGRGQQAIVLRSTAVYPLTVRVLDSDSKPCDASVWTEAIEEARLGDYEWIGDHPIANPAPKVLHVPAGETRLFVRSGQRHRPVERLLRIDGPTELTVTLEPSPKIRGQVLDESGAPAAEAGVQYGDWWGECDDDGRFEVFLPEDRPLVAWKDGHGHSEPVPIAAQTSSDGLVLRLRPSCALQLRLRQTIPRGYVRVFTDGVTQDLRLDGPGRLHVADLPPGPAEACILLDDEREGPRVAFELVAGETTRVELPVR